MEIPFAEEVGPLHAAFPEILSRLVPDETAHGELFAEQTFLESLVIRYDRWKAYREPWESYDTDTSDGTALRVIADGQSRHGYVDGFDPALVRIKADELRGGPPGEAIVSRQPPRGTLTGPADAVHLVSIEEKRALLESAVGAALSLEPRLRELEVEMQGKTRESYVVSTEDRPAFSISTIVGIRVRAIIEHSNRHLETYSIGGGTGGVGQFLMTPPDEIAALAVERLQAVMEAKVMDTSLGSIPVVIEGGWGGVWLHEVVGHLLEADTAGPYTADRIGEQVAPEGVTIIDDGTLKHGRGTSLFDDEGCATEETVLIEQGILRNLMADRLQAIKHGIPRTGNGRRQDYRHEPLVRMTNLYLDGGSADRSDLIADVDKGLYVRTIGSGKVYPGEDRFSFNVLEGNLIEQGRLTQSVSGLRLSGKPSEMLQRVDGIASDFEIDRSRGVCDKQGQKLPVSVGMPTILVRDMTVDPIK